MQSPVTSRVPCEAPGRIKFYSTKGRAAQLIKFVQTFAGLLTTYISEDKRVIPKLRVDIGFAESGLRQATQPRARSDHPLLPPKIVMQKQSLQVSQTSSHHNVHQKEEQIQQLQCNLDA